MAQLLNDSELKKLLGTTIVDGEEECIKPNSYELRLGKEGEFINTGKEFELGKKKKGIKVRPGHSVAITAHETLDFRRKTIQKIYPDADLHAILTPKTDLSREGIVAPTTQVDAGYNGTINWTITNTSNEERRFLFKEKIYRLSIFKLEEDESPSKLYAGEYQSKTGYVRSQRRGAPTGVREADWVAPETEEGPEKLLESLVNSGYPWNILGRKLKIVDQQFQSVTDEYGEIYDSIQDMKKDVDKIDKNYESLSQRIPDTVRKYLKEETISLQNRWLTGSGSLIVIILGIILTVLGNENATRFVQENGSIIGIILLLLGGFILFMISRQSKNISHE